MDKSVPQNRKIPTASAAITNHNVVMPAPVSRSWPDMHKPFSVVELQARTHGENYLQLANTYRAANDLLNAVSCCLEGLALTVGISRPLAVRDQLLDLLERLDPSGAVSRQLRMCMDSAPRQRSRHEPATGQIRRATPKYLERSVSAHQLLAYPSEYRRFNRAFEDALACLKQIPTVCELYIVQYRPQFADLNDGGKLHFSFVPAALISRNGPYFLTDICAVLRQ